jgi:CheY-like chemotaxis protein
MTKHIHKILLAEDDPNDVELTRIALQKHNLANELEVVNNGELALDYLYCRGEYESRPKGNPAVVLLDLKMPKLDGKEVLRVMRSDQRFKKIPVVIMTSSRENPDVEECYELGANSYVVKPVNFKEFVDVVKEVGLFWAVINVLPEDE